MSVVDLTSTPPKVMQSLGAGAGATTVRLSPDGTLAMVANRVEGSVSVFTVSGKRLTPAGKVQFGRQSGPSSLVFSKDGKTVLVSRHMDHTVSVLHVNGTTVEVDKRPITTALSPFTMDVNADQTLVAVTNLGRGDGDVDSVSLIDLTRSPPVAVSIMGVASGPEPLKFSPDGRFLAVGAQLGTQVALDDQFYHDRGLLQIFAVRGHNLTQVATAQVGRWLEGIAWSREGDKILVQNDRDRTISVFGFDGHALTAMPDLIPTGGPAAFGVPWP